MVMGFIESELFHDTIRNSSVYEKLLVDFIVPESWWHLFEGSSSTKREGTWSFWKVLRRFYSHGVMMTFIKGSCFTRREGTWSLRKVPGRFYMQGVRMTFIEEVLFHDQRRKLICFEKVRIDFSDMDLRCHLLNGSSSTIREGTWPFSKGSLPILLTPSDDGNYWRETHPW
jgi:hypothetical protein